MPMPLSKKKRTRLFDVKVDEISLVDKGAIGVPFLLYKRDEEPLPGEMEAATNLIRELDCLDFIERIEAGIDDLKKRSFADYKEWRLCPESFIYSFSGPGEGEGRLTITKKLGSGRCVDLMTGFPLGETRSHKFNRDKIVWEPKQKRDQQGRLCKGR